MQSLTASRLAHRLRDLQSLPYAVVTNPHMSHVYELYYSAFEAFRKARPVRTVNDNQEYCVLVKKLLEDHLTIIPKLAIGVLECRDLMPAEDIDRLMYSLLRSVSTRPSFGCSASLIHVVANFTPTYC